MQDSSVIDEATPQATGGPAGLTQDDRDWIQGCLADVAEGQSHLPQLTDRLLQALDRVLAPPVDDRTFPAVLDAVSALAGQRAAELFEFLVKAPAERLPQAAALDPQGALDPFRVAIAVHGGELTRVFDLATQLDDDWKSVSQYTYFDTLGSRYVLRASILKYDGSRYDLQSSPSGMLDLMRAITRGVLAVGQRDAFSDAAIAAYLVEADALRLLLQPEGAGAVDAEPSRAAAPSPVPSPSAAT